MINDFVGNVVALVEPIFVEILRSQRPRKGWSREVLGGEVLFSSLTEALLSCDATTLILIIMQN